ncbi:MAG: TonB-dependent receptor [Cytophagaceae bacterium]|nr:TonB-dependent receptor [Cytophagaceae bacterium]
MKKLLPFCFFIYLSIELTAQHRFTISGYIKEEQSLETLPGVNIVCRSLQASASSNEYGFYSLTLQSSDSVVVDIVMYGYEKRQLRVAPKDTTLDIELKTFEKVMKEVVVKGKKEETKVSESAQMSTIDIPVSQIKDLPMLGGEKDVLKTIQLMPGVQKGSEGSSGVYVRGGGPDQNLIILDDAVVYNSQHLFGFFSVFNGDALKSVELIKGGFPAHYGGRLSSVINMTMKDGNKEAFHGEAGIGLISSRIMLEGPIVKKKSSFLVSARRTYADLLIQPFLPKGQKGGYYFYDFNAKVNYQLGEKDKIYLSGYFGRDKFYAKSKGESSRYEANLFWGNATSTLRWNHVYNKKLFQNTSLIFSNFNFNIGVKDKTSEAEYSLKYYSLIRDFSLKSDFSYHPSAKHTIKLGVISTLHTFKPQASEFKDTYTETSSNDVQRYAALESGIYVEDVYKPHPRVLLNGGIRLSAYHADGIQQWRPEPRFTSSYLIKENFSFKASYAVMNQYIHLLSNTGIGLPTDLWVPATSRIVPERSSIVAAGFAKDFEKQKMALTVEGYYKDIKNIVTYKEGATFFNIDFDDLEKRNISWEDNVTQGKSWSYGLEVLLQKKVGKFSGWAGYTLSWTYQQFDSVNFGRKFFARYDRRHDISLVGIYHISPRTTLSAVWVFGSGNMVTLPTAIAPNPGQIYGSEFGYIDIGYYQSAYEARNNYRMPAYHRLDLGMQFHKEKKRYTRTWDISIYNVYSRLNAFFLTWENEQYRTGKNQFSLYKTALFPIIPSITYNIKF